MTQQQYLEGSRALSVQENETKNRIAQLNAEVQRNNDIERATIGSISQKTAKLTQLEKEYKSLSEVQRNNKLVGGCLRTEYQAITKEVEGLNKELSGTKSQGAGSIITNLKSIAAAAGIPFGADALVRFGTELFDIAKEAEGVAIAFARIGDDSDLEKLRVATKVL